MNGDVMYLNYVSFQIQINFVKRSTNFLIDLPWYINFKYLY